MFKKEDLEYIETQTEIQRHKIGLTAAAKIHFNAMRSEEMSDLE